MSIRGVDWLDGSRTEGRRVYCLPQDKPYRSHFGFSFGPHMHALFRRAKREGLRMERETW